MADSRAGLIGPPRIDGYEISHASVADEDITSEPVGTVLELADRDRREFWCDWGSGYPLNKRKHRAVLRYLHLRDDYDRVEELFATPGPHDVVLWKRVHIAYAGNGTRSAFVLPWRVATHFYAPPGGQPLAPFAMEVRVGFEGTALTVAEKDAATYAAGPVPAGEAWVLDEGQAFKLEAAPAAGAMVYVRLVPILEMFHEGPTQKRYVGPVREPRDLVLVEA